MSPLGAQDASLIQTAALPAGATTTATAGYDLQNSPRGSFVALVEFQLSLPALTSTQLPNGDTIIYALQHDTDPAFTSPAATTLVPELAIQTGASSAGAAAQLVTFRLPQEMQEYVRVTATGVSGVAASGANMTLTPLF